ncbi:MAG TPA: DUF1858 domain-containing protein [Anaerolineae bacterium]|nr:DUF1858 domain-containing protein [Anaerolineae bacterium]
MTGLIISPKTKVADLLDAYPGLEDALIHLVPAFEKLRNPVLRRTVARITTLQQAAAIGGAKVDDLITHLRKAVGQDSFSGAEAAAYNRQQPAWFDAERVAAGLDARPMLAAGEQPVNQVIAELNAQRPGDIYKLVAPFLPAPLVDKATSLGVSHWITQEGDLYVIYFAKV